LVRSCPIQGRGLTSIRWFENCVCMAFGPMVAADLRRRRPKPLTTWHLDEVYLKIDGRMVYLWRAVDAESEMLDVAVQTRSNKRAALKLMRKLLKKYGSAPDSLVTDDLRSYAAGPLISGSRTARSAADCATTEPRIRINSPDEGSARCKGSRARAQPRVSLNACSNPQHLQRSKPSPPSPSRIGDEYVARRSRGRLKICEPQVSRVLLLAT
jgi:hypothetical protein